MPHAIYRSAAAIVALTFALTACTKTSTDQQTGSTHAWTIPGELRIGEFVDATSLVPEFASSELPLDLSMFIFSYAVRYDAQSRPVPDALSEIPTVENGDVSKDGLTLKYKLRSNITWQDGQPLTCADLAFTWHVIMNPHNNVETTDGFNDIASIDCSDPHVAVIHMKKVYAPFLQQLWGVNGNAPILPEHLLAKYNDDKGSMNSAPYLALPVGSGPFKVVEWQRGSEVQLDAYPGFYGGKPKLNHVVFRVLPDENTMETQLQTHELDMIANGSGLNWPRYSALASDPRNGLKAVSINSFIFSHIDFNLRHPIVGDVAVRRALAYATNRQEIIDKIFHGQAAAAETDQLPALSWAATTNIAHYPYDPAKARALLDAAGWKVGADGVRVKDGQRLEFDLSTQTESTAGKAVQTVVQREWRDIGVQADIKNAPSASFFENGSSGILEGGHYDVAFYSWSAAADPDDGALYDSQYLAPAGQNTLFWVNPKVDAAERDARSTVDQARRKADYAIVQQQMALDVPTIVVFFRKNIFVYNVDLTGFDPSPVISGFWNPWEYSI